jgi:ribonuclease P protein component
MRRDYRLRRSRDFERVRSNGRSWAHPLLITYACARGDEAPTRAGVVVSKRVGKATIRNRVKRRIREALRASYPTLRPGYDLIVIARPPAASTSLRDLSAALDQLLDRARVRRQGAMSTDAVAKEVAS